MNLDSFTGPGSTPSRRRFWDKVTQAVLASQKVSGKNVSVAEHQGYGSIISVNPQRGGAGGACCDEEGNCTTSTQAECAGTFQGVGTDCDPNPCGGGATGACCTDGECSISTEGECTGDYLGDGTTCEGVDCTCEFCTCHIIAKCGFPTYECDGCFASYHNCDDPATCSDEITCSSPSYQVFLLSETGSGCFGEGDCYTDYFDPIDCSFHPQEATCDPGNFTRSGEFTTEMLRDTVDDRYVALYGECPGVLLHYLSDDESFYTVCCLEM